jgi:hypothetical protein
MIATSSLANDTDALVSDRLCGVRRAAIMDMAKFAAAPKAMKDYELSVRLRHILKAMVPPVETIGQLLDMIENAGGQPKPEYFGRKSFHESREILANAGLRAPFSMDESFPRPKKESPPRELGCSVYLTESELLYLGRNPDLPQSFSAKLAKAMDQLC